MAILHDQCHANVQRFDESPLGIKVVAHCLQVLTSLSRKLPDSMNLLNGQHSRFEVGFQVALLFLQCGDRRLKPSLAVGQHLFIRVTCQVQIKQSLKLRLIVGQQLIDDGQPFADRLVICLQFLMVCPQITLQSYWIGQE